MEHHEQPQLGSNELLRNLNEQLEMQASSKTSNIN
jgi:hypothetical protein